jgi:hypothetical protein
MNEMGEYPWAVNVGGQGPMWKFTFKGIAEFKGIAGAYPQWTSVAPTPETMKITAFLKQFEDEGEFIAWCQGQGVKGMRANGHKCLLAKAVKMATGQDVGVDHHSIMHLLEERRMAPVFLPLALAEVPRKFDQQFWPELEVRDAIRTAD